MKKLMFVLSTIFFTISSVLMIVTAIFFIKNDLFHQGIFTSGFVPGIDIFNEDDENEDMETEDNCEDVLILSNVDPENIDVIGDSIIVGSTPEIEKHTGVRIDGKVGRAFGAIYEVIDGFEGGLRDYVVIGLANNAAISREQLNELLNTYGEGRTFLFILGYSEIQNHEIILQNNLLIQGLSRQYNNVYYANWPALVELNEEYLASDRLHLATTEAQQAYSNLIFGKNYRDSSSSCE